MPYYGDFRAGDPGLFSFVKKIKLGKIVGGLVKAAFPGASGVLTAVNAIRQVTAAPSPAAAPTRELTVAVPTTVPAASVRVTRTRARRATATRARFTTKGKAVSAFAQRMAAARAAAARRRGGR